MRDDDDQCRDQADADGLVRLLHVRQCREKALSWLSGTVPSRRRACFSAIGLRRFRLPVLFVSGTRRWRWPGHLAQVLAQTPFLSGVVGLP
jgi:hypothetical protein